MRRVWITLTVFAVATALALPAAAGKPDGPPGLDKAPPEVNGYEVTMEFLDDFDGFSTTTNNCMGDGVTSVTVESSEEGPAPMLDVRIGGVNWYRYYPYHANVPGDLDPDLYPSAEAAWSTDGVLEGCHGAGIDVTISWKDGVKVIDDSRPISQYPGLLMIVPHDGSINFLWHSDYYREWENVSRLEKKPRYVATDIEDFTYSAEFRWLNADGSPVVWDPAVGATGTVSGDVRISHFSPGTYAPFDTDEDGNPVAYPFPVKFELAMMPIPGDG